MSIVCNPAGFADDLSTAQAITRLEHQLAEAALKGDASAVENLLAPGFIGVNPQGKELTRDEVLKSLVSPDRKMTSLVHNEIRVRVFGDCAIVLAVTKMSFQSNGEELSGEFPYMRVWIHRKGKWIAAATQSMVVPQMPGLTKDK